MSWSLGETKALAIKATRGCGFSWGLSEEAGFAVEWLQARAAPGVTALAQYLQYCNQLSNIPATTIHNNVLTEQQDYHPLHLGSYMLDADYLIEFSNIQIYKPLLLLPFISEISSLKHHSITWGNNVIMVDKNCVLNDNSPSLLLDKARCTINSVQQETHSIESKKLITRIPSSMAEDIAILEKFAARTYAPDTQESRLSGAGAGVTDND